MSKTRPSLGQLLVDGGLISQGALDEILSELRSDPRPLSAVLVERGVISADRLTQLLSFQLSVPWVSLTHVRFQPELLKLIPKELATRCRVVPVYIRSHQRRSTLYVAMDDPTNTIALTECEKVAKLPVRAMVASPGDVDAALSEEYGEAARDSVEELEVEPDKPSPPEAATAPVPPKSAAPEEPAGDPEELDESALLSAPPPPLAYPAVVQSDDGATELGMEDIVPPPPLPLGAEDSEDSEPSEKGTAEGTVEPAGEPEAKKDGALDDDWEIPQDLSGAAEVETATAGDGGTPGAASTPALPIPPPPADLTKAAQTSGGDDEAKPAASAAPPKSPRTSSPPPPPVSPSGKLPSNVPKIVVSPPVSVLSPPTPGPPLAPGPVSSRPRPSSPPPAPAPSARPSSPPPAPSARPSSPPPAPSARPSSPPIPPPISMPTSPVSGPVSQRQIPLDFADSVASPSDDVPRVIVIDPRIPVVDRVRSAADGIDTEVKQASMAEALARTKAKRPMAIVVMEDLYEMDRVAFNQLALQSRAHLVVWGEDLEPETLHPVLATARRFWNPDD